MYGGMKPPKARRNVPERLAEADLLPQAQYRYNDAAFLRWAEAKKPCKRCGVEFVGPVCDCERR